MCILQMIKNFKEWKSKNYKNMCVKTYSKKIKFVIDACELYVFGIILSLVGISVNELVGLIIVFYILGNRFRN